MGAPVLVKTGAGVSHLYTDTERKPLTQDSQKAYQFIDSKNQYPLGKPR